MIVLLFKLFSASHLVNFHIIISHAFFLSTCFTFSDLRFMCMFLFLFLHDFFHMLICHTWFLPAFFFCIISQGFNITEWNAPSRVDTIDYSHHHVKSIKAVCKVCLKQSIYKTRVKNIQQIRRHDSAAGELITQC